MPFYRFARMFFQVIACRFWKIHVFNRHFEPTSGSVVYISNHQSFMDPVLIGFAVRRPMNFMARDSLFRFPICKQIITATNAFPVKRNTADTGAMKEALRRLKAGGQLAIFPEGTRTLDGRIGEFLPGVALLAQRAARWVVPVLIDGAFEVWPRWQKLPTPGGKITVQYAPPIPQSEIRKLSPTQFVARIREQLIDMQSEVRRRTNKPEINYDTP
jgi:1-acyl-sn-glycerol-3-phosphate acyltransferase